jgi:hypothetical protein
MAQTRFSGPVVSDNGFVGDISLSTSVASLTDNSGGTSGGDTIAAIADGNNAGSADLAETQNAIATLSAKVNAILAALGQ